MDTSKHGEHRPLEAPERAWRRSQALGWSTRRRPRSSSCPRRCRASRSGALRRGVCAPVAAPMSAGPDEGLVRGPRGTVHAAELAAPCPRGVREDDGWWLRCRRDESKARQAGMLSVHEILCIKAKQLLDAKEAGAADSQAASGPRSAQAGTPAIWIDGVYTCTDVKAGAAGPAAPTRSGGSGAVAPARRR